jgi:hypothetical protein
MRPLVVPDPRTSKRKVVEQFLEYGFIEDYTKDEREEVIHIASSKICIFGDILHIVGFLQSTFSYL